MFLPDTRIEIIHPDMPRAALFDFDGTLSLIREGWPEIMIEMMVEILAATPRAEGRAELKPYIEEFVMRLNGQPTMHQMLQLEDEVRARGGAPRPAVEYKQQFLDLLGARVTSRVTAIQTGAIERERHTVPGTRDLLHDLRGAGVHLYLASGTDLPNVRHELTTLDLHDFFEPRVYGAVPEPQVFTKGLIVAQMVRDHQLGPGELVGFGDGYVEIQEVKAAGGVAVGVASDEKHRTGVSAWKRDQLLRAGADVIVPDYRDRGVLLQYLGIVGEV